MRKPSARCKEKASKIQIDISKLIEDMNKSIAQAEKFMKTAR